MHVYRRLSTALPVTLILSSFFLVELIVIPFSLSFQFVENEWHSESGGFHMIVSSRCRPRVLVRPNELR